jgi:hypothetical protein
VPVVDQDEIISAAAHLEKFNHVIPHGPFVGPSLVDRRIIA